MRAPRVLLTGLIGFAPILSANAVARGPDAHVVRQGKGDILVVRDAAGIDRYVPPAAGRMYKPVRVGQRLPAVAYAPRYFAAAPSGSAPARGTRRWIRYGDDLILVNLRGGRVERVLPGGY